MDPAEEWRREGEKKKEHQEEFQCQEVERSSGTIILRVEVVDFEPELKEQVPKKSKHLQRRGLAG